MVAWRDLQGALRKPGGPEEVVWNLASQSWTGNGTNQRLLAGLVLSHGTIGI